jgi:hypothetical protein
VSNCSRGCMDRGTDVRNLARGLHCLMEIVANTLIVLGGVILLFGAAGVTIGLVLRSRRR